MNLDLNQLRPINKAFAARRNSRMSAGVSIMQNAIYFNNNFIEKYNVINDGVVVLFDHPSDNKSFLLSFFSSHDSVFPQWKTSAISYKKNRAAGLLVYTAWPFDTFGKQKNVSFELITIQNVPFFKFDPIEGIKEVKKYTKR